MKKILILIFLGLLVAGCSPRQQSKGPLRLEDMSEAYLRKKIENAYVAGSWRDTVEWYVTSHAAHDGFLDFNYRANMLARGKDMRGRDSLAMFRVSIVPTYGKYPDDYYDIRVEKVEPQEGDF